MSVQLSPVPGIRLGVAQAAIKRAGRDDLLVIESAAGSSCAAVFTQNAFCAAPVMLARRHMESHPRWLLINSGNANAGTGSRGMDDAIECCKGLAQAAGGADPDQVLPFSTGVIGEYLPLDRMLEAIPLAVANMATDKWDQAARAIMTTDTRPKAASRLIQCDAGNVVLTGICKGSGMIHPNMATMLAFIGTDAKIPQTLLQSLLARAVDQTFNCISVDGDTSTNDACVLLASGHSGVEIGDEQSLDCRLFFDALLSLCSELAEAIVRDGEGATKLIHVQVQGAANRDEARKVGFTVAHSPLVKTAFFASDPNWGRILAAVGRAGSAELEIERVNIWLDEVQIVENGGRCDRYEESSGAAVMAKPEITIRIELGRGEGEAVIKTCDFSYDYVRINAEYRT